ncbi:MAG TPA: caspase family protein [Roseiarcus sp.]|nr:caspase family protein [Roseiarcus sp.]
MNAHTGKFALVLGNGAYSPAWKLDSPPLDFKGMRDALVGLGFEVDGAPDLGFNEMNGAVDAFAEKLKIAARVQAALFYYSGHGCARQRQNYMFPIDFDDPTSAENRLLATQSVIDRISGARNQDFVKIILLDACRVDAEGAERYEARVEAAVQSKGVRGPDGALAALPIGEIRSRFTEMTGEANTFIAFAAAEGTQAQGTEKGLSLFTGALLRNFDAVDLPLTNLLSRVRVIIRRQKLEAANQQIAWDQSSLNQPTSSIPAPFSSLHSLQAMPWRSSALSFHSSPTASYCKRDCRGVGRQRLRFCLCCPSPSCFMACRALHAIEGQLRC